MNRGWTRRSSAAQWDEFVMSSGRKLAWVAALLVGLLACAMPVEEDAELGASEQALTSTYEQVYIRGTLTGWDAARSIQMTLANDHYWVARVTFPSGAPASFKFDVRNDWSLNLGDNDGDQRADRNGRNIEVEPGKTYEITFDDESSYYTVYERVPSGSAILILSVSGPGNAAALLTRSVYATSADLGTTQLGIYHDEETGRYYVPMANHVGRYTAKIDTYVAGIHYVGETTFDVLEDQEIDVPFAITSTQEDTGTLVVRAYSDRINEGRYERFPYGGLGIYLNAWQAGDRLGTTEENGTFTTLMPVGSFSLTTFKMTSSHSIVSTGPHAVEIQKGKTSEVEVFISPYRVLFIAHADVGFGNALYVIGQAPGLGQWQRAMRMTWDASRRAWVYETNVPVGAAFKVVRAPGPPQLTSRRPT